MRGEQVGGIKEKGTVRRYVCTYNWMNHYVGY